MNGTYGRAATPCSDSPKDSSARCESHPWVVGLAIGAFITFFAPQEQGWFPVAMRLGVIVYILGDMMTNEGRNLAWPFAIKPPKAIANLPILKQCWHSNGYMTIPVLGHAGSIREWLLLVPIGAYDVRRRRDPRRHGRVRAARAGGRGRLGPLVRREASYCSAPTEMTLRAFSASCSSSPTYVSSWKIPCVFGDEAARNASAAATLACPLDVRWAVSKDLAPSGFHVFAYPRGATPSTRPW